MAIKRPKPEEIVVKLRQVEVVTGLGMPRIDEIASEVGYAEPSAFRSAFKKPVGMNASEYRRKWQANLSHAFERIT